MANLGNRIKNIETSAGKRAINERLERLGRIRSTNISSYATIRQGQLQSQALGRISLKAGRTVVRHDLGEAPKTVTITPEGSIKVYTDPKRPPDATRVWLIADIAGYATVVVAA